MKFNVIEPIEKNLMKSGNSLVLGVPSSILKALDVNIKSYIQISYNVSRETIEIKKAVNFDDTLKRPFKSGNSLVVVIPCEIVEELELTKESLVNISLDNDIIIIKVVK